MPFINPIKVMKILPEIKIRPQRMMYHPIRFFASNVFAIWKFMEDHMLE